jgi:hypothetical protein
VAVVYHFSEDSAIERFTPHVPATNPNHRPAVWAIDEGHAPLYWFPRDCPRVTAWPRDEAEGAAFRSAFTTDSSRVHAMELAWLTRMRGTDLYRYDLPADRFRLVRLGNAGARDCSETSGPDLGPENA